MKRFLVLDALRFLLALCVAIGHLNIFPLFGPIDQPDVVLNFLARGFRTVVYGPAAVIAFFVISGFCIHYPFAATKDVCPIARFYARRYIRILVPVFATVAIFKLVSPDTHILGRDSILWHSTLWSIVCEEIYYAFYPLLNRIARETGWARLLITSCLPAIFVCVYYFPSVEWQDIGIVATTLTLAPVWLSGCYLAENISARNQTYSTSEIWLYRLGAWTVMWLALILHAHTFFYQTVTGPLVGAAYYFWIKAEIGYYRERSPWRLLVWGGRWSYSLYLIHPIAIGACLRYGGLSAQSRGEWMLIMAVTLVASYLFYVLVERPSHMFARRIPLLSTESRSLGPTSTKSA